METLAQPVSVDPQTAMVTLIVPVRNEGEHIDACLAAVAAQDHPRQLLEIIVVDGDSTDDTAARVRRWAERHPRVRLLHNPKRLLIPGLNVGIRHASGAYVGYVNGHSYPPADYVTRCIALLKRHGAWGVGGAYERVATTPLQRAIGRAQSHPFGVGDAFHNYGTQGRWAETVFPGFWPRWVFDRIGLFDERMLANEDNEFSHRIRAAGGRVWYEPSVRVGYSPRRSLSGLFRQYLGYGLGKAMVFREHLGAVRLRHLAPAAFVGALVLGAVMGPFIPEIGIAVAVAAGFYLLIAAAAALSAARGGVSPLLLAAAFVVMHVAYGVGTWIGFVRVLLGASRRTPSAV